MLIVVLKLTGEGEIFFVQERYGRGLKTFNLLKFATMLKDGPNMDGGTITVSGDPRILPVGKFLRDSKLNELPQLINVVKGDMSLIGPRPLTEQTLPKSLEARQKIFSVRPGLSGLASVVFRSEEKLLHGDTADIYVRLIAPHKEALELWYVEHASLSLYVKLVISTIMVVVSDKTVDTTFFGVDVPSPSDELAEVMSAVASM